MDWSTLVPTLLGGVLSIGGGWLAGRQLSTSRRQEVQLQDQRTLVGDFLVNTDRLWRATDGVCMSALTGAHARHPEWQRRWLEDTEERRVSGLAAFRAMEVLSIVRPDLDTPGRELYDACMNSYESVSAQDEWLNRRSAAHSAFRSAARRVLL